MDHITRATIFTFVVIDIFLQPTIINGLVWFKVLVGDSPHKKTESANTPKQCDVMGQQSACREVGRSGWTDGLKLQLVGLRRELT